MVVGQQVRGRRDREVHDQLAAGHSIPQQRVDLRGVHVLVVGVVDHHHRCGAAGAQALDHDSVKRPSAVVSPTFTRACVTGGRSAARRRASSRRRCGRSARASGRPAGGELRVVGQHLLDLHPWHAEVLDNQSMSWSATKPRTSGCGAGRQRQRRSSRPVALLQRLELGLQMLHRRKVGAFTGRTPRRSC